MVPTCHAVLTNHLIREPMQFLFEVVTIVGECKCEKYRDKCASLIGCLIAVRLNNVMPSSEGVKSLFDMDKAPQ